MGGSGGGFFSGGSDPEELRRRVRASEDSTRNDRFEVEVSSLIDSHLADANRRDSDAIGRHLEEIEAALDQDIDGAVKLRFGGSIKKHTYVDGLSDIDALVILNASELQGKDPAEVRSYFAQCLSDRFPQTSVEEGDLTVTVSFADVQIQLLPAIKVGAGVRIPSVDTSAWSPTIRPDKFADKLTKVNQALNGKVVPTIKLAKSILSQLPENQRLSGYHVESLAIQVFEGYEGPQTTKAMLRHFFTEASNHLKQPIKDSTGQSIHVDDYLGGAGNLRRRIAVDSIGRIGRSMKNADGANSVEQWREILGDTPDND